MKFLFSLFFIAVSLCQTIGQTAVMPKDSVKETAEVNKLLAIADSLYKTETQDAEAAVYYEKALALTKLDITIMNIKDLLGTCYGTQKRYDEAFKMYNEALAMGEQYIHTNRAVSGRQVAKTWSNRGMLYRKIKNYEKAIEDLSSSIALLEIFVQEGDESEETHIAKMQFAIGVCCAELKDFPRVQEAFFKTLAIWQKRLLKGQKQYLKDYQNTFRSLETLQGIYVKEKDFMKIVELETGRAKSKEALMNVLDNGRYTTASHYGLLAFFQVLAKQYTAAEQTAYYGLKIDDSVTKIKSVIAHSLLFQKKDDEAKKIYEALKTQKDAKGDSYKDVLATELGAFDDLDFDKKQIAKAKKWIE